MAAGEQSDVHDVEQLEVMFLFIASECPFGHHVVKLVFGVDVFDLDFWVQIDSIEQPIKCNSVSPGNVSHRRTPSFNDHLDHCFKKMYQKALW